jgi:hypothetical protein
MNGAARRSGSNAVVAVLSLQQERGVPRGVQLLPQHAFDLSPTSCEAD